MGFSCQSCGYDNDPTRVYCHSCGIRLERGAAAVSPTGFTHPTEFVKMKKPRKSIPWGGLFGALVKLAIVVGLVAAIVLGLMTPEGVPPAAERNEKLVDQLNTLVTNSAMEGAGKRGFGLTQQAINQWLITTAEFQPRTSTLQVQPERIYTQLLDGVVRLGLEVSPPWFGHLYFEADYKPVKVGGGYTLEPVRYSVGKLPIPIFPGWPVKQKFESFSESLIPLLTMLQKASAVTVTPEKVNIQWGQ